MAGMLFGFPFNEELFSYRWANEPDPTSTALLQSGAVQNNADIANQISNGSDVYTIPFYKTIGGEPANYDGNTDVPIEDTEGAYQSGIVYGRMQGWRAKDFVFDYNSGADPMSQIASQVSKFWAKQNQATLINVLNGVFTKIKTDSSTMTPNPSGGNMTDWRSQFASDHTLDISSSSMSVSDFNRLGAGTMGDCAVKACGDQAKGKFGLAVMHSTVANNLDNLQLLQYRKYTDPQGIERTLGIADVNGFTVVIDDGVPHQKTSIDSQAPKYVTYLLGVGAIQQADAPVKHPVELTRDAKTKGGQDELITRVRRTIQPNGFSYTKPVSGSPSPTNADLEDSSRWTPIYNPKSIAMARVISNG